MSLSASERSIIVTREIEKADRTFDDVLFCMKEGKWEAAANRLYYALFHAVSALLINDGHEVGTHKGAVIRFHQYYVKTGIFSNEDGAFYSQMQSMRERADYNCYYDVTETEIVERLEPTSQLIEKIKEYIGKK